MFTFETFGSFFLRILIAFVFVVMAIEKLSVELFPVHAFEGVGIGDWILLIVGIFELIGAIGLVSTRTSFWSATFLALATAGALVINLLLATDSLFNEIALLLALIAVIVDKRIETARATKLVAS